MNYNPLPAIPRITHAPKKSNHRVGRTVEGLYYLCSENKGADQLPGYREADLPLCFRICKKPVFSQCGSYIAQLILKRHIFIKENVH